VNITVKISRTKETKKIDLEKGSTVEQVLKKINLKPDSVLVIRNNKPIPFDEELNYNQELDIIQVSSGG
jgi:sulfur carrier protein ThiS